MKRGMWLILGVAGAAVLFACLGVPDAIEDGLMAEMRPGGMRQKGLFSTPHTNLSSRDDLG
jgi:hypothetical protein